MFLSMFLLLILRLEEICIPYMLLKSEIISTTINQVVRLQNVIKIFLYVSNGIKLFETLSIN